MLLHIGIAGKRLSQPLFEHRTEDLEYAPGHFNGKQRQGHLCNGLHHVIKLQFFQYTDGFLELGGSDVLNGFRDCLSLLHL